MRNLTSQQLLASQEAYLQSWLYVCLTEKNHCPKTGLIGLLGDRCLHAHLIQRSWPYKPS